MSLKRFVICGSTLLITASFLPGCGSSGPAAGLPSDVPAQGVAPVLEVKPIKPSDKPTTTGPRAPTAARP